jgi:hypothetical protein
MFPVCSVTYVPSLYPRRGLHQDVLCAEHRHRDPSEALENAKRAASRLRSIGTAADTNPRHVSRRLLLCRVELIWLIADPLAARTQCEVAWSLSRYRSRA